jgi:hypothetical protein
MDAKKQLQAKLLKRRHKSEKRVTFKLAVERKSVDEEAARQQRLQAISLIAGLWAKRADAPKDGLAYQEALRAEW